MTNFPRRVHVQQVVVADEVGQLVARPLQACLDTRYEDAAHVVFDAFAHLTFGLLFRHVAAGTDEFVVLGGDHDGVYPYRASRLVVLDGHLALGVGPEIGGISLCSRRSTASSFMMTWASISVAGMYSRVSSQA